MRLFIAIPMPEEMKNKIAGFMVDFTKDITGVKWVAPEKAHLTLAFLGEQKESQLASIISAVKDASKNLKRFDLRLKAVGAFPEKGWPRVVWIGVSDEGNNLSICAQNVRGELKKRSIAFDEKDFKEHITIGRVRNIPLNMKEALQKRIDSNKGIEFGKVEVNSIVVYSSAFEKGAQAYTVQKEQSIA